MGSYIGSPTGSGNPPGEHSESYLKSSGGGEAHFVDNASYRGSMHVPINDSATEIGNQPKQNSQESLESFSNKKSSI